MKVQPICKYGHGGLALVTNEDTGEPAVWAATAIRENENKQINLYFGTAYTFFVYRCPVCGYLEMFDNVE